MRPGIENPFAPRDHGHFVAITPRVRLWRSIVNSTLFVGERGCALVDTQVNHALARRVLAAIAAEVGKPLLYVINTHYHWDHTNGNPVFQAAGATLLASRRTARAMVERAPRQKAFLSGRGFELGPDPTAPDAFAEEHPELDLGGLTLRLIPGSRAETADPTLVWCPQERVLAAGDTVMTGSFPIFGQPSQREGLEDGAWLTALEEVRSFQPEFVTPGHGPVAQAAELATLERICRYFLEQVPTHHAAGRTLSETIRLMEDEMPAWITRIPQVWGTPRYAILRVWAGLADLGEPGWQHHKPSSLPDAAPVSLSERWQEAIEQCLEGGDPAQALALARAATAAHPQEPGAWTSVAQTVMACSRSIPSVLEKGDCFATAKAALAQALEIDPQYGPALLRAGEFQVMMAFRNGEDPARGLALLERAAAWPALTTRQQAELRFYRGMAARSQGDELGAHQLFRAAMVLDPSFRPAMLADLA